MHIYTDGGSKEAHGKWCGGWGAFYTGQGKEWGHWSAGPENCTNNGAELLAYNNALENILTNGWSKAQVFLDSRYVMNGALKNLDRWNKNGYVGVDGAPIKNVELWQDTHALQTQLKVKNLMPRLIKVKGHSGNRGNDEADALASLGRDHAIAGGAPEVFTVNGLLTETTATEETVTSSPTLETIAEVLKDEVESSETTQTETKAKAVKIAPANAFLALDRILDVTHREQPISHCGRTIYMLTSFSTQAKSEDDEDASSKRKKIEAKTRNCGHIIPDSCLGVALLKDPCRIYSEIRQAQNKIATRSADYPFLIDWSSVIVKTQWTTFNTLPLDEVITHKGPNLYLYKGEADKKGKRPTDQFGYFLGVPRLARDAVEYSIVLLSALDDYRNGTLEAPGIDISDLFYETDKKGKRVAKKTTDVGRSLTIDVEHNGKTVPVILTAGSDIPKMPALLRILKQDPTTKVTLIKRVLTPVSFRIAVVFEGEEDLAIYAGPATSIQLVA